MQPQLNTIIPGKRTGRPKNKDLISFKNCPAVIKELCGVTRSEQSVYYWATQGLIDRHGTRVILRTTMRIKQFYTTKEWLRLFLEAI